MSRAPMPGFRDKQLSRETFVSLREAQILIEARRRHHNTARPRNPLGYRLLTPERIVSPSRPSGVELDRSACSRQTWNWSSTKAAHCRSEELRGQRAPRDISMLPLVSGPLRWPIFVGGVRLMELPASDLVAQQPGERQDGGLFTGLRRAAVVGRDAGDWSFELPPAHQAVASREVLLCRTSHARRQCAWQDGFSLLSSG